jgi:serine/threonine-protein kinase
MDALSLPAQFGAYVLLERLGQGAQGDVHLARPVGASFPLVIKRLSPEVARRPDFVSRFRHEATIATLIDSPHVAKVFDAGRVGDQPYIAMEYIAGWPFTAIIREHHQRGDVLSLESVADLVTGVLAGLDALHTAVAGDGRQLGIIHRDIAPKNLMLSEDGTPKVIDLGLGKSRRQDWQTATGIVMGTPGYLSPEQANADTVDHRADLYAMGIVLFELITLERYVAIAPVAQMLEAATQSRYRPPSSLRSGVPPELDEIVRRAVALDPAERFPSAKEFSRALRAVVPARPEPSRSLLGAMSWTDSAKTRAVVERLVRAPFDADPAETSRRVVFSERSLERAHAPTLPEPAPKRSAPPFAIGAAILAGGLAFTAAGWFGRGLFDAPPPASAPASPTDAVRVVSKVEAAPETVPIAVGTSSRLGASGRGDPTGGPSAAKLPVVAGAPERGKAPARSPPRRIDPPPPDPPPPAASAPPPEAESTADRLRAKAAAARELSRTGPPSISGEARALGAKLLRLAGDPSLGSRQDEADDLLRQFDALAARGTQSSR